MPTTCLPDVALAIGIQWAIAHLPQTLLANQALPRACPFSLTENHVGRRVDSREVREQLNASSELRSALLPLGMSGGLPKLPPCPESYLVQPSDLALGHMPK
jgi:hypothetical protein